MNTRFLKLQSSQTKEDRLIQRIFGNLSGKIKVYNTSPKMCVSDNEDSCFTSESDSESSAVETLSYEDSLTSSS